MPYMIRRFVQANKENACKYTEGVTDHKPQEQLHHAGAILMYEQASLIDQQIQQLCQAIIVNQQVEIDQMRTLLAELEK